MDKWEKAFQAAFRCRVLMVMLQVPYSRFLSASRCPLWHTFHPLRHCGTTARPLDWWAHPQYPVLPARHGCICKTDQTVRPRSPSIPPGIQWYTIHSDQTRTLHVTERAKTSLFHIVVSKLHQWPNCSRGCIELGHLVLVNHCPKNDLHLGYVGTPSNCA